MAETTVEQVKQTLADVFGLDAAQVSETSSMETIEAWDSMGHMNLVLALEQAFGIGIDPEEIPQLTSVGVIAARIDAKLETPS
ncbi:MAG: acyl carrier protein [Phycisphaeraceae bacterium]|nr:acyl carrier protein [Phycisphaeraceae bacterium]